MTRKVMSSNMDNIVISKRGRKKVCIWNLNTLHIYFTNAPIIPMTKSTRWSAELRTLIFGESRKIDLWNTGEQLQVVIEWYRQNINNLDRKSND